MAVIASTSSLRCVSFAVSPPTPAPRRWFLYCCVAVSVGATSVSIETQPSVDAVALDFGEAIVSVNSKDHLVFGRKSFTALANDAISTAQTRHRSTRVKERQLSPVGAPTDDDGTTLSGRSRSGQLASPRTTLRGAWAGHSSRNGRKPGFSALHAQQFEVAGTGLTASETMSISGYQLRVCNAYDSKESLELSRLEEPKVVEYPLAFGECKEYTLPLREGDRLLFRAGNIDMGVFKMEGLPSQGTNTVLMLIPYRRVNATNSSTTTHLSHRKKHGVRGNRYDELDEEEWPLAFKSHSFDVSDEAQVAVIDASSNNDGMLLHIDGADAASVGTQIADAFSAADGEELEFNSVVSLVPGDYRLAVSDRKGNNRSHVPLSARDKTCYVVIRMGGAPNVSATTSTMSVPAEKMGSKKRGKGAPTQDYFSERLVVFPTLQDLQLDDAQRGDAVAVLSAKRCIVIALVIAILA